MLETPAKTKPLIYCSQCHNSVYRGTSVLPPTHIAYGDRICLYCYKHGIYMRRNAHIGNCRDCIPEDVNKLRKGIWRINNAYSDSPN